ncbi:hypothetical protein [Streptomyces omiyaensis]|uniref:hypothetical protein n=1 Tax=Streptomyces omiyaensis TaxID=68247 RepID=UPI001675262E|nr:hypothetical protein [Streptomyces omiyaensis]GGY46220.1 membrane protein [Streptomyces omiyaensis]
MPTPRHHLNQQRRRRARADAPAPATPSAPAPAAAGERDAGPGAPVGVLTGPAPRTRRRPAAKPVPEGAGAPEREEGGGPAAKGPRRRVPLLVLCVLTLLLGGFAGWAQSRAGALRDDPARGNTALTDPARTSEVKGRTAEAVAALFSYDHTDPGAFEQAGKAFLTGRAVEQHRTLFAGVLAQAARQKSVITTTVTESAVERIDGDRARVLVYADQSSVSTAGAPKPAAGGAKAKAQEQAQDQGVYAGAMFAVDVVRRNGTWLVENIDTFGR